MRAEAMKRSSGVSKPKLAKKFHRRMKSSEGIGTRPGAGVVAYKPLDGGVEYVRGVARTGSVIKLLKA